MFTARSKSVYARGRAMVIGVVCAIAVAGGGIGLYMALAGGGQMPEYARAAPASSPMFVELGLPKGALEDASLFTESRLLSEKGRERARELWDEMLEHSPLTEEQTEALHSVRRIAVVPISGEFTQAQLEFMEPPDVAVIVEFDNTAARDLVLEELHLEETFVSIEHRGNALLVGAQTKESAQEVADRIKNPQSDNLSTTDSMREAISVNRGFGLFIYMDPINGWGNPAMFSDTVFPGYGMTAKQQEQLVKGLEELLAPEEQGPVGIWVGLDEIHSVQRVGDVPAMRAGLYAKSDESMMSKLPENTPMFLRFGLFEESVSATLETLSERAPTLWQLAHDALADEPEEYQFPALLDRARAIGDPLTGQGIAGLTRLNGKPAFVVSVGVEDHDALLKALKEEHPYPDDFVERDGMHIISDSSWEALFLEEDAFVFISPAGNWDSDDSVVDAYLKAREGSSLADASDLRKAFHGIDRDGTFVFAANARRAIELFDDEEMLKEVHASLADEWISMSSSFDGRYASVKVNVGLRDLAALTLVSIELIGRAFDDLMHGDYAAPYGETDYDYSYSANEITRDSQVRQLYEAVQHYQVRLESRGISPSTPETLQQLIDGPEEWEGEWWPTINRIPDNPWGHPYEYVVDDLEAGHYRIICYGRDGLYEDYSLVYPPWGGSRFDYGDDDDDDGWEYDGDDTEDRDDDERDNGEGEEADE